MLSRLQASRRIGALALIITLLSLALVALLSPAPAQAHDALIASDPASDAQLDAAPVQVSLTFNSAVLDTGAEIRVLDGDGVDRTSGDTAIDGSVVSVPIAEDAPSGTYTVQWRVVSSDGHPVSNQFQFTVLPHTQPTESPLASQGAQQTPTGESPHSASPSASSPMAATGSGDEAATESQSPSWLVPVFAATAVVLIGGLIVWLTGRNPKNRGTNPKSSSPKK